MVRDKLITSIFFASILATAFVHAGDVEAVVKGDCDVCHVLFPGVPRYELPYTLCIECHSNANPDTIKIFGRSNVPIVFNSTKPNRPLAGGNFHFVVGGSGERKGHNVDGISPPDTKFRGSPPGYSRSLDVSAIGYTDTRTLKCSGSNGCHGNRNIEDPVKAIMGTHHAVDKPLDGSTTAKSYRYLKNSDKVKGVVGNEDGEWNRNSSPGEHNEYTPSIDAFCESCHGDFHRDDKDGPWFRHPTGIPLPKEYEYRQYNPEAPVGRTARLESPRGEVNPGSDVVICLSCHVAHASPYESMLRWDYDSIVTGEKGNGGCLICHTGK
ncbi:MAG: cytochrome c3 family protein [Nitrospirota bacterium]